MLDPSRFSRLVALIRETESDTILVTSDAALRDMAEEAGIPVQSNLTYALEGADDNPEAQSKETLSKGLPP